MNSARGGFDSSFDSQTSYMSGKSDGGNVFDPKMGQYGQGQFAQPQRGQNNAPQSKGISSFSLFFVKVYNFYNFINIYLFQ